MEHISPHNYRILLLQSHTAWGGLKGCQVMAQPQPVFARIEDQSELNGGSEATKKVSKKKEKTPKSKKVVEA